MVSDLDRMRPIWFGGSPKKCKRVQLAVMDMWKAFRNSTGRNAPQASILFDKFHIMRHLGDALDTVRKPHNLRRKRLTRALSAPY
ncbi:MAG TPA: transposase [Candidatus Margulisiibacteriota bacterium]|nr:transposase [Candidatus Margulisiibacteriota bacterium]